MAHLVWRESRRCGSLETERESDCSAPQRAPHTARAPLCGGSADSHLTSITPHTTPLSKHNWNCPWNCRRMMLDCWEVPVRPQIRRVALVTVVMPPWNPSPMLPPSPDGTIIGKKRLRESFAERLRASHKETAPPCPSAAAAVASSLERYEGRAEAWVASQRRHGSFSSSSQNCRLSRDLKAPAMTLFQGRAGS